MITCSQERNTLSTRALSADPRGYECNKQYPNTRESSESVGFCTASAFGGSVWEITIEEGKEAFQSGLVSTEVTKSLPESADQLTKFSMESAL